MVSGASVAGKCLLGTDPSQSPGAVLLSALCLRFTLPQGDLIDWKEPASLCIFLLSYFQLFYVKLWQHSPLAPHSLPMLFWLPYGFLSRSQNGFEVSG